MAHHSCIGWVQVGGAWALWMLHFHVCPWFFCCSCVCHDLEACLAFVAHSATHSWPLVKWMSHWVFILYILPPPCAGSYLGMGLSFFNPTLTLFVGWSTPSLCRPVVYAMLLFDLCLLGLFWACCMLSFYSIPIAQYYRWACTHVVLRFIGPFHHFQAPLAHFILLGILGPFHFLEHPWSIPILHFHGLLLSLLGFPNPNYHILYFRGL